MASGVPKDDYSDSLLPPSTEESCDGQSTPASFYHVHVNTCPGETHTDDAQTAPCVDEASQEKPPLTDAPLNPEQLAMLSNNKDVPPPYQAHPAQQPVWNTDTNKEDPKPPRRLIRRYVIPYSVLLRILLFVASIIIGFAFFFKGLMALGANSDFAYKLSFIKDDAMITVNEVQDLYNIPADYDGKLIYVTGPLSVTESLEFGECEISVRCAKLRRIIDRSDPYTKSASDEPYFSSKKWPQTRLDGDHVCVAPYRKYESELSQDRVDKIADVVKIGPLIVGERFKEKLDEFYVVVDKLVQVDNMTAFRVAYSAAGRNGDTYSFMGKLNNGTIDTHKLLDSYNLILQRVSEVPVDEMLENRTAYLLSELRAENWWSFLMIAIGVVIPVVMSVYYITFIISLRKKNQHQVLVNAPT